VKNALTLHAHIKGIVAKHGGLRPAARVLSMTPQYLYRLFNGEKDNPSAKVLRKLGLKRIVLYVPTESRTKETR
jgi:DNA-binding phage protein